MPDDEDNFTLPARSGEEVKPYELEPEAARTAPASRATSSSPPSAPSTPASSSSTPPEPTQATANPGSTGAARPSAPVSPRADAAAEDRPTLKAKQEAKPVRMGKGGLLDEFDEDADFTHDPEVEAAARPAGWKDKLAKRLDTFEHLGEPLVQAGKIGVKPLLVGGGVGVLGAMVNAARGVWKHGFGAASASAIDTGYAAVTNLVLGVAGLTIAAFLLGRKLGRLDLAIARMLIAVAIGHFVFKFDTGVLANWDEPVLAVIAYALTIKTLFRFTPMETLVVATCHFALWVFFLLGPQLSAWAGAMQKAGA